MSIFLPITALCFLESEIIHMILLTIGFAMSSLFLIRGILSMDKKLGDKEKMVMGVFILGVQLILVLMYKFYFFHLYWSNFIQFRLLYKLLINELVYYHLLLKLRKGRVWQSPRLRKLFYFTCNIELGREESLKLFLAIFFLHSSLFWANTFIISTWSPTTFPKADTYYSTFWPHIQREDFF